MGKILGEIVTALIVIWFGVAYAASLLWMVKLLAGMFA